MYSMRIVVSVFIMYIIFHAMLVASTMVPANDPNIQYFGRWDFSNPLAPSHSWPGVYIYAEFQGTSIGIRTDDNACWYNIFIDTLPYPVFHGTTSGVTTYTLATGLSNSTHTILITKRGETSWTKFSFYGFVLDDGKSLLPPPPKPIRKIEFLGDSYTSASGNEWKDNTQAPDDSYTNVYLGFGPIIARHFNAQYMMTSRGGIGLVLDWQGNITDNLPGVYDRALYYSGEPKWDFSKWSPDLAVICLGLNDFNGWGGYSSPVSEENASYFRAKYHDFVATVMGENPGTNILIVAANGIPWLQNNVSQVAAEENAMGHTNVHYASFPLYDAGGYVNLWHPNVATHQKIADTLIAALHSFDAWTPYRGTAAPKVTKLPLSGFTVYDTTYDLNIQTDSYATMRYSTQDKPYNQMEHDFTTTGKKSHAVTLSGRQGSGNKYYLRGKDVYGNIMDTSAVIQFFVDTTKTVVRWMADTYDRTHWKTGKSPLGGVSDTGVATRISAVKTTYYYSTFTISGIESINSFTLRMSGHDGMVVYLNGKEYTRINMTGDPMTDSTLAIQPLQVNQPLWIIAEGGLLRRGVNTIAVEVHTASSTTPSTFFNATLQDDNGMYHFTTGSSWLYEDSGKMPPDLIINKPTLGVSDRTEGKPANPKLYANYPNPFNPETTFKFDMSAKTHVRLSVFNMLGQEIAVVLDGQKDAGSYTVQFSAAHLASGVYFYRMEADSYVATKKMIVLK
jgi:hypothetical protein